MTPLQRRRRSRSPLSRLYLFITLLLGLTVTSVLLAGMASADPVRTGRGLSVVLPDGRTTSSNRIVVSDTPVRPPDVSDQAIYEQKLLELINARRAERKLPPLKRNDALAAAARAHSQSMARFDYFGPEGQDASNLAVRLTAAGYQNPTKIAETLGAGHQSPEEVLAAWLSAPEFSANLFDTNLMEIGSGYAFDAKDTFGPYYHYWSLEFGARRDVFPVVINNETQQTASPNVTLYLYGTGFAKEMMIANDASFKDAQWQPYQATVNWTLTGEDGNKTVYVRLRDAAGTVRQASDSIAMVNVTAAIHSRVALPAPRVRPAAGAPLSAAESTTGSGFPPGFYETSSYMAGKVAVGVFLPQSNGAIDRVTETWTTAQEDQVVQKVQDCTNWWIARKPNARLQFVFDVHKRVPISYEPINRSSNDEGLWVSQALGTLGYNSGDEFARTYAYTNDLRQNLGTDWAFAIFVVNSANDADGKFPDGYFAYSYLGGPFLIMTYKNGSWGIDNMGGVCAHEVGHIFWALDQYSTANVPVSQRSGYLYVENGNTQAGTGLSNVPSIMRNPSYFSAGAVDTYAQGQTGFKDSANSGTIDPLRTTPTVTLNIYTPNPTTQTRPVYTGAAQDNPFPSQNTNIASATINKITLVQYRVNNGAWQPATPSDGAFNSVYEAFSFTPALNPGTNVIEVQATNAAGLTSTLARDTLVVQGAAVTPTPPPQPTAQPTATAQATSTPAPGATPAVGAQSFTFKTFLPAILYTPKQQKPYP